jgi:plasmid maintenance system antidote protein VapI
MSWQLNRSMGPFELVEAISKLGLSQAATARFLDLSERQIARMIHAETPVPTYVALLLNALIHHNETPVVPQRKKRIVPPDSLDTS